MEPAPAGHLRSRGPRTIQRPQIAGILKPAVARSISTGKIPP